MTDVRTPIGDRFSISIDGCFGTNGPDVEACWHCPGRCRRHHLARRTFGNGSSAVWIQCVDCGRGVRAVRREFIEEAEGAGCVVGEWDDSFRRLEEANAEASRAVVLERQELRDIERRRRYQAHLASEAWQAIRSKVLRRDRNLCQGCLEAPAVHVHHLSYDHLGDELLFELTSLCRACHEKIHPHLREGHR